MRDRAKYISAKSTVASRPVSVWHPVDSPVPLLRGSFTGSSPRSTPSGVEWRVTSNRARPVALFFESGAWLATYLGHECCSLIRPSRVAIWVERQRRRFADSFRVAGQAAASRPATDADPDAVRAPVIAAIYRMQEARISARVIFLGRVIQCFLGFLAGRVFDPDVAIATCLQSDLRRCYGNEATLFKSTKRLARFDAVGGRCRATSSVLGLPRT
jgi:hypothetical protein